MLAVIRHRCLAVVFIFCRSQMIVKNSVLHLRRITQRHRAHDSAEKLKQPDRHRLATRAGMGFSHNLCCASVSPSAKWHHHGMPGCLRAFMISGNQYRGSVDKA